MMHKYFMRFLITVFLSTLVLGNQNYRSKSLPDSCDEIGTFCSSDCRSLLLCIKPDQKPQPIECGTISEHQFCKETNSNTAACSADTNECEVPNPKKIVCGNFGEFPHPFECNKTIQCGVQNEEASGTCHCSDADYKIDITASGLPCTKFVNDDDRKNCIQTYVCPTGQTVTMGNNYCYTCTDDGFAVYFCSKIRMYSEIVPIAENDKLCSQTPSSPPVTPNSTEPTLSEPTTTPEPPTPSEPNTTEPSNTSDPTSSEPTTVPESSQSPTVTDLPSTTSSPNYNCSKYQERFPDPLDCHSYYWCNKNLQLEHRKCAAKTYYHKGSGTCQSGDCQNDY